MIAGILNQGYTYDVVRRAIFNSFYSHQPFPIVSFNKLVEGNLLRHSVRYYHKELIVRNEPQVYKHDVDTGDITSSITEFFVEPRASYTLQDLLTYFQNNVPYDKSLYSYNRLRGIFKNYVNKLGVEITLFMIEKAIRVYHEDGTQFDYKRFDDYQPIARQYLEENKNSVAYSGGADYVFRKRMLLD